MFYIVNNYNIMKEVAFKKIKISKSSFRLLMGALDSMCNVDNRVYL